MEYFVIIISAIFVNNILLSQFMGICPFLGVSTKVSTAAGMGAAVTFVMTIASIAAYLLQYYVLVPLHIEYMQTIVFILVIAALVQMVEIILKKVSPALIAAIAPMMVTMRKIKDGTRCQLRSHCLTPFSGNGQQHVAEGNRRFHRNDLPPLLL